MGKLILDAFNFSPSFFNNLNNGMISHVSLDLTAACNLRCNYCFRSDDQKNYGQDLTVEERKLLIEEARKRGARILSIGGEGEPFLDRYLKETVLIADRLKMITIIYSNLTTITKEMAKFLANHRVSLMMKMDSLDEINYGQITRKPFFQLYQNGLQNVLNAYKNSCKKVNGVIITRLGASMVVTNLNKDEIKKIKKFCDDHDIYLICKTPTRLGRAYKNWSLLMVNDRNLLKIAQRYTSRRLSVPLDENGACALYRYGLAVGRTGDVLICPDMKQLTAGNIRRDSLDVCLKRKKKLLWRYPKNIFCLPKYLFQNK